MTVVEPAGTSHGASIDDPVVESRSSAPPDAPKDGPTVPKFAHQPALDGLRALAVLGVILYHGNVAWMRGGFLGVDAFLVLSGFLITSLMLTEWRTSGGLALRAFWGRRSRRLIPALALMLIAVCVYAAFWATAAQVRDLRREGLSTVFYVANWERIFTGTSYFDQFGEVSLLRHTWSLAIEEQWYLIWPLLFPFILRVTKGVTRRVMLVLGAMAAASALWMFFLYSPDGDPSRVYFGTDTRAQALLIGAALGVWMLRRRPQHAPSRGNWLLQVAALGAFIGLGWMWTAVGDQTFWLYRGGFTIEALLVALVIAAAVQPQGPVRTVLSVQPLRWIGLISYGLYLWHWPIWVALNGRVSSDTRLLWTLALTFACATASYYLVERPIRTGAISTRYAVRLIPAVAVGLCVALITVTSTSGDLAKRRAAAARTLDVADISSNALKDQLEKQQSIAQQVGTVRVLVAGDSVALTLASSFTQAAGGNLAVHGVGLPGCGLARGKIVDPRGKLKQVCEVWPSLWKTGVEEFPPDVVVLLTGAWEVFDRVVDGRRLRFDSPEYVEYFESELDRSLEIVAPSPMVVLSMPCNTMDGFFPWGPAIDRVNEMLRDFANRHADRVQLLDLNGYVCPLTKWNAELGGAPFYPDGMHFSDASGALVWRWLGPQLVTTVARERGMAPSSTASPVPGSSTPVPSSTVR